VTVKVNQIRKWDEKWEFNKSKYDPYFIVLDILYTNQIYIIIRTFEDGTILKYTEGMIEDCSYEVEDKDGTE
jgi:hypothetical protein